jgi:hypothetical protein
VCICMHKTECIFMCTCVCICMHKTECIFMCTCTCVSLGSSGGDSSTAGEGKTAQKLSYAEQRASDRARDSGARQKKEWACSLATGFRRILPYATPEEEQEDTRGIPRLALSPEQQTARMATYDALISGAAKYSRGHSRLLTH